ncbi:MAG TPA: uridine kinase [Candidatus Limihabitans stercoravium]|nr:uridine kinase [Candidatus Limihabitans stercoravium]
MDRLVIGIAGGTGSGKTTVARKLHQAFGKNAVILSHDYYYKANEGMSFEQRARLNYDHPNALDTQLLVEHITKLKRGEAIEHPTYNFSTYSRNEHWEHLEPAKIIIVEGILLFENKQLCDICDMKLFVDTDADVRFIRRLRRDVNKRGRTMESVIKQYMSTVKPMHEMFVEPSKRKADIIIPEGGHNTIAVSTIIDAINKKLADN